MLASVSFTGTINWSVGSCCFIIDIAVFGGIVVDDVICVDGAIGFFFRLAFFAVFVDGTVVIVVATVDITVVEVTFFDGRVRLGRLVFGVGVVVI